MPGRVTCLALTLMGALVAISPASASSAIHGGAKGHISIQQLTFAGTQFGTLPAIRRWLRRISWRYL